MSNQSAQLFMKLHRTRYDSNMRSQAKLEKHLAKIMPQEWGHITDQSFFLVVTVLRLLRRSISSSDYLMSGGLIVRPDP